MSAARLASLSLIFLSSSGGRFENIPHPLITEAPARMAPKNAVLDGNLRVNMATFT
jgi:hypothetical protein